MYISQGIEHFFNYQRLNVKKNTFRSYEFILSNFRTHFGDIELSSITSDYDSVMPENGQDVGKDIMEKEGLSFNYIKKPKQAADAVPKLKKGESPLGLDTETGKLPEYIDHNQAGLEPHLSRIRLIQLYGGDDTVYILDIYTLNIDVLEPIWDKPLVAYNMVFDLKYLFYAGADYCGYTLRAK